MKLILCLLKVNYFLSIIKISNLQVITDNYAEKNLTNGEGNEKFLNRKRRAVVLLRTIKIWEDGIIPYEFDSRVNGQQQQYIRQRMREWERSTCIQFVPRNIKIHQNYVNFTSTESCKCCYLKTNIKIYINLHDYCFEKSTILHELGHAIGFLHEHNRPDRDKFIQVQYYHIHEKSLPQYIKYPNHGVTTLGTSYDYYSVMHYVKNIVPIGPMADSVLKTENSTPSDTDIATANLMYNCCSCKTNFYEPSGAFEQPNDDKNGKFSSFERCEWRIRAAEGERIQLNISSLNIWKSYNCVLDYLEVRNGHDPNSEVLARYCGKIDQLMVIASNIILVTWVKITLHYTSSSFKVEYKTICGNFVDLKNDTAYNFESPNFPEPYQPNKQCHWNFSAPENHKISLNFTFFKIEKSENCTKDYIRLIDGNDVDSPIFGNFCGVKNYLKIKSTKNRLNVLFSSDSQVQEAGFSATVIAVPKIFN
ncbi:GSCOCG00002067001-RA-CDS [Cotesia congregata]|nr:GSCOCG00002067001-RA-CDS [Cotesia congregata]